MSGGPDTNMKKEPTNQAEIRHPPCQCCICQEMRLQEAQGADNTNTPPDEVGGSTGHPVSVAGHAGGGGGLSSMRDISKTEGCDLDPTPQ